MNHHTGAVSNLFDLAEPRLNGIGIAPPVLSLYS
jgi:hypothetical protein